MDDAAAANLAKKVAGKRIRSAVEFAEEKKDGVKSDCSHKNAVEATGGTVRKVYYNKLGFRGLLKPEWSEKKGRLHLKAARPPPKQKDKVDSIGRLPAPTKPIPFEDQEKQATMSASPT